MIESLRIENFQSLKKLEVECGPITVFHGESDTGKSAIVRALYALAFNAYPRGHVREGATDSVIEVTVDGEMIRATKGTTSNRYELEHSVWDRVGTSVPEQVTELLGWRTLEVDDGTRFTPNFARQFDPPFLLTETPSRKAKLLGSLTNIAILYAAIKEAGKWERKAKEKAEAYSEIHGTTTEARGVLEIEYELKKDVFDQVEALNNEVKAAAGELAKLSGWIDAVEVKKDHVGQVQANIEKLREKEFSLLELEELISELDMVDEHLVRVGKLSEVTLWAGGQVKKAEGLLAETEAEIEALKAEVKVCPVCGGEWC